MFQRLIFSQFNRFKIVVGSVLAIVTGLGGCSHGHGSWKMNVLLDNHAVQLLEVNFNAGSKTPRHHHRDALIYALSDAHVLITGSDGKPVETQLRANQVLWRDAEMRTLENIGNTDLHVLNFDLKKPSGRNRPPGMAENTLELSPDIYSLLLDNHRVKVLEVRAKPGTKTPPHAHADAVLYFLSDVRLKFIFPDGKLEELNHKKGEAVWLPAQEHALEVLGDAEVMFLVVEMKAAL